MRVVVEATTIWESRLEGRWEVNAIWATIRTFTCLLVKFVSDIGVEHQEFLKPTNVLFPSTGVITKRIYDQLQGFDQKTLLFSVLLVVTQETGQRKWGTIILRNFMG
jgi:hypothetical protein